MFAASLHQLRRASKLFVPMASKASQSGFKFDASIAIPKQNFEYFLVLDFEATCQEGPKIFPQEIIEFPVLKVNAQTLATEATFHKYVQPRVHKELTSFCTKLTGIIQEMVDNQPHLEEVLQDFHNWMQQEGLLDQSTASAFVTCGDWDLNVMLPSQCAHFGIPLPLYMTRWINIKRVFSDVMGRYPRQDLMEMLRLLNLAHQGRHHSGIDDVRNIANILGELVIRGAAPSITGEFRPRPGQFKEQAGSS
uniref:Exonuclease domain-containing protein n=3 Tax=Macrostomum lignano TaxID=282301 RepID=A0A1I8HZR1_9PLAT